MPGGVWWLSWGCLGGVRKDFWGSVFGMSAGVSLVGLGECHFCHMNNLSSHVDNQWGCLGVCRVAQVVQASKPGFEDFSNL